MADKYINETGLVAIKTWIEGKFAKDADLDTLSDRVDEIIAEGAEPNVIETVKVNGTALTPDAQKAVNVLTPTVESDENNEAIGVTGLDGTLEYYGEIKFTSTSNGLNVKKTYNSGNYDNVELASKNYVDANGGKIDAIKVNNVTQQILNKTVDIEVIDVDWESDRTKIMKRGGLSSAIEFIENENGAELSFGKGSAQSQTRVYKTLVDKTYVDGTFRTEAQVQAAIDAALEDITGIDFQIVSELPATGEHGVIYLVEDTTAHAGVYVEYIWLTPEGGTPYFEKIGTTEVDLSNYWTSVTGKTNSLVAMTTAEINAILEPSA